MVVEPIHMPKTIGVSSFEYTAVRFIHSNDAPARACCRFLRSCCARQRSTAVCFVLCLQQREVPKVRNIPAHTEYTPVA